MNVFVALGGASRGNRRDETVRKLVRGAGQALSTSFPRLACRVAAWLWSAPPQSRCGQVPEGADAIEVRLDGHAAKGYVWRGRDANAPRVLVQHGWGGAVFTMAPLIEALVDSGCTVIAVDAFNHGRSGRGRHGWRQSSLIEMSDLAYEVAKCCGPFDAVVAHSAGAAAISRAVRRGLRATRCVFVAPLVDPLGQTQHFSQMLGLSEAVSARWPDVLLERFGSSHDDIDMRALPSAMPQTLVIQDQDDRFSPPADARALHAALPNSELMETRGLGHVRLLADPAVLARMAEFVLASAPRYRCIEPAAHAMGGAQAR